MAALTDKPIALNEAAGRGARFQGSLASAQVPRLTALVAQSVEDAVGGQPLPLTVSATLEFNRRGKPAHVVVSGKISAQFSLLCQRCLELAPLHLQLPVAVALCAPELPEEEWTGEDAERWDHVGEAFDMPAFVDEFVLLALPLVVSHDALTDCGKLAQQALPGQVGGEGIQTPFAGLSELLADKGSQ